MKHSPIARIKASLLALSHELGREDRELAILREGNTSARLSSKTFLVKASKSNLAKLSPAELTECRFNRLLPLLEDTKLSEAEVDDAFRGARVDSSAKLPSVETAFHAYLLTLPGVNYVGHTHPITVNQLLCSKLARTFARRRMSTGEIECCGVESAFVPFTDPGLKLAQAIRRSVNAYLRRWSRPPVVILMENHGFIALGASPEIVLAATLMAEKAARVFVGAAAAAGAPRFLSPAQVSRLASQDAHLRPPAAGD